MKLIVNLKLNPLESQHNALLNTLKQANKSCDWISAQAFQNKIFKQFDLHKLCYKIARETFDLSAQIVVRQIKKVVDSYKIQKKQQTTFKPTGSIAYDDRIISFKKDARVSIWTVNGRLNIPFECGEHQRNLLKCRKGEIDLIYRKGNFYLNAVCDVPEDSPLTPTDIIGVDFGIVSLATDSMGETFTGQAVEKVRQRYSTQRQVLQYKASKQSQSGKRPRHIHKLIKRLSGREKNFRKLENHKISKKLVEKAKTLNSAIALEDLKHIRQRIEPTVKREQRAKFSGWSFAELRAFISYKAKLSGIPVYFVNPKNTSRECNQCGYTDQANRKSQSEFVCLQCNHTENADINASKNIRSRAFVNTLQSSENVKEQFLT